MTPDSLRELARKTAIAITDSGSKEMATLKETIKLHDKVDELLNKPEVEMPTTMEMTLKGVSLVTLKGDKGDSPTEEELISLIEPLIPVVENGKDGKDYILTKKDKKDIANIIKVPVVEKIIEKIEVIKEVQLNETPIEIRNKLESIKEENEKLDISAIKGWKELLDKVKTTGNKVIGGGARFLSSLLDVTVTSPTNGQALVYDSNTGLWKNGTISGGTGSPGGTTGTVQYNDGVGGFAGNSNIIYDAGSNNLLLTAREYITFNSATPATLTDPTLQATNSINGYTQLSIQNKNNGINSSADIIAYPNNVTDDINGGWMDMGITSSTFAQAIYAVTGFNEGYIFMSAPNGSGTSGNMIIATDSTGTANDIAFFTGGLDNLANERFRIKSTGIITPIDLEVSDTTKGLVLKSPNGTRFRIGITNNGELTATSL